MNDPNGNETELLAYIRERDTKRRRNIKRFVVWGVVAVIAGMTFNNYMHDKRESERLEDQRVHDFGCAMNRQLCG